MLGRWEVPIYNDTYVMLFFGLLKKLVSKWLTADANQVSKTVNSSEREKCTAHSDTCACECLTLARGAGGRTLPSYLQRG